MLSVTSKKGRSSLYSPIQNQEGNSRKLKTESTEKELLLSRKEELEYELELCIAEAQGYEEMKGLLPSYHRLLNSRKTEAKKRAIKLNGLLTSTLTILKEFQA